MMVSDGLRSTLIWSKLKKFTRGACPQAFELLERCAFYVCKEKIPRTARAAWQDQPHSMCVPPPPFFNLWIRPWDLPYLLDQTPLSISRPSQIVAEPPDVLNEIPDGCQVKMGTPSKMGIPQNGDSPNWGPQNGDPGSPFSYEIRDPGSPIF